MDIINLSGNFQPPSVNSEVVNGRSLPQPSSRAPSAGRNVISNNEQSLQRTNKVASEKPVGQLVNIDTAAKVQKENQTKVEIRDQVEALQQFNQNIERTLQFEIDEELGVTIVRVFDKETEELIRQFPPEELLNLSRRLKELNEQNAGAASKTGILLQEKV